MHTNVVHMQDLLNIFRNMTELSTVFTEISKTVKKRDQNNAPSLTKTTLVHRPSHACRALWVIFPYMAIQLTAITTITIGNHIIDLCFCKCILYDTFPQNSRTKASDRCS